MARSDEADVQTLHESVSYHEDAIESLKRYFADWERIDSDRYVGMTRLEINEVLRRRLTETERRSILQLLTSLEAALRLDYRSRCQQEPDDPLSNAFRAIYEQRAERVRLNEILELWIRHHPELATITGQVRNAFYLRHWLAHGRYWQPGDWVRYSYLEIEALASAFFNGFPFFN